MKQQQSSILLNKMNVSNASLLRMQESTDTLVDETNFVNKKKILSEKVINKGFSSFSNDASASTTDDDDPNIHVLDDVFELNNKQTSCIENGNTNSG